MMADDSNSFAEIKIADWSVAFSDAMSRTPFDGIFHRLYLAMDVDRYTGPIRQPFRPGSANYDGRRNYD